MSTANVIQKVKTIQNEMAAYATYLERLTAHNSQCERLGSEIADLESQLKQLRRIRISVEG